MKPSDNYRKSVAKETVLRSNNSYFKLKTDINSNFIKKSLIENLNFEPTD